MTDNRQGKKILVGFDGSEGSRLALEWAAGEAASRGVDLEVFRAWTPGEFGTDEEMLDYAQSHLEKEVQEILPETSVRWTALAERGAAAKLLSERGRDAQMLVVGSRGHGAISSLLLGSVSSQVATHPGAPVVVIVKETV